MGQKRFMRNQKYCAHVRLYIPCSISASTDHSTTGISVKKHVKDINDTNELLATYGVSTAGPLPSTYGIGLMPIVEPFWESCN